MKFYDYASGWSEIKRAGLDTMLGWKDDGEAAESMLNDSRLLNGDPISFRHCVFTMKWRKLNSPYYDVYPSIIRMLSSISLDFPGEVVHPPMGISDLLLRLPIGDDTLPEVRTIFISFQPCNRKAGEINPEWGLVVGMDFGEQDEIGGISLPIFTMRIFPLDDRTVEDAVNSLPVHRSFHEGKVIPDTTIDRCVRTAIATCMLQDDSSILEPQVLSKDALRVTDENRDRLVDKARRRGRYGFSLGKGIEVIPHIRRPHPALVWTGKGRKIPKIIFRKGSVIHREVVEKIPTGKGDSDLLDVGSGL